MTSKTQTQNRTAARKTKDAVVKTNAPSPSPDTPYVLTRDDVIASFAAVRRDDAGNAVADTVCGAPMIDRSGGYITAAQMAREIGVSGKTFRGWLRAKGLPRQVANADDAARIMRAYASRGARPVLSTDDGAAS